MLALIPLFCLTIDLATVLYSWEVPTMTISLDRRTFLQSTAAAGAALSLGMANQSVRAAADRNEPLFKISLAEWSFHRALKAGKMDNLDFPKVAKQDFDI